MITKPTILGGRDWIVIRRDDDLKRRDLACLQKYKLVSGGSAFC